MTEAIERLTDLLATARKAGASAADAVSYESTAISVSRRMRNPEGLERAESKGIGLRVFVGDRSAVVSSSDMSKDTLKEMLTRAIAMAKLAPADPHSMIASKALLAKTIPELDLYDAHEPTPEWLQEQCAKAEDAALAITGITNSEGADAGYSSGSMTLVTSNGFAGSYKTSNVSFSVSVLAGEGTHMERDYDFTSARFISDLMPAETIGRNAAHYALARLNPRKASTQQVTAIFDPRVSKGLLGAFAGAINGNSIARGTSFLKDAMGKAVFNDVITIVDEPHRKRGHASKPYDGEGVANRKTLFVEKGELKSWVLDVRSASKLGLSTTGHATRGLSSPPSPSTTNLYMMPGALTPEDLMSDIASGFYVTEVFGMGVNLVTGDYSQGASGFWIENGKKTYPVSEITIAGKLQDMFMRATPANDLTFRYGTNAPTLRIEGMTVAGV